MANWENNELEDEFDDRDMMPLEWYIASKKTSNQIASAWQIHLMEIDVDDQMTDVYFGFPQLMPEKYKHNYFVLFGDREMEMQTLHVGIVTGETIFKWIEEESQMSPRAPSQDPDITEVHLIDTELKEGKRPLQSLIEALTPIVTVIDTKGDLKVTGNVSEREKYEPYYECEIKGMQGIGGGVLAVIEAEKEEKKTNES